MSTNTLIRDNPQRVNPKFHTQPKRQIVSRSDYLPKPRCPHSMIAHKFRIALEIMGIRFVEYLNDLKTKTLNQNIVQCVSPKIRPVESNQWIHSFLASQILFTFADFSGKNFYLKILSGFKNKKLWTEFFQKKSKKYKNEKNNHEVHDPTCRRLA